MPVQPFDLYELVSLCQLDNIRFHHSILLVIDHVHIYKEGENIHGILIQHLVERGGKSFNAIFIQVHEEEERSQLHLD
jgi:hypothetical protein